MTLDKVRKGQQIKIISILDEIIRVQAIRFGIAEGSVVTCQEKVPAGPIVLRKNNQEIAIGRNLANKIDVALN